MSVKLNPNCKLPCRNYIFHFDGSSWRCVASNNNDAIGMLFSDFMALLGIKFPDDANYLFCRTNDREVKIRQYGFDIELYINPLNGNLL